MQEEEQGKAALRTVSDKVAFLHRELAASETWDKADKKPDGALGVYFDERVADLLPAKAADFDARWMDKFRKVLWNQKVNLVLHRYLRGDKRVDETNGACADLQSLVDWGKSDKNWNEVQTDREKNDADLGILFIPDLKGTAGIASILTPYLLKDEKETPKLACALVDIDKGNIAGAMHAFDHETLHLFGCHHAIGGGHTISNMEIGDQVPKTSGPISKLGGLLKLEGDVPKTTCDSDEGRRRTGFRVLLDPPARPRRQFRL